LIILGLLLAVMLNRRIKFNSVYLTVLFIPWVISDVISGITWRWLFNSQFSLLDFLLSPFGIVPSSWITKAWGAMGIVTAVHIWRNLAFSVLLLLAALQNIGPELYEASKIDGATGWSAFRKITLPLIMPTLLTATLLILIGAINQTGMILVLTNGGPVRATETLGVFMYREAFMNYHLTGGAALSAVLAFINAVIAALYFAAMKYQRR
jgi:multiple sugar transport system permease protein